MTSRISLAFAVVGLSILTSTFAFAQVPDAVGDFLPSYTGIQGGDLDVVLANVQVTPTDFIFSATMNAAIGTTPGALYVFGVDRGVGTPRLAGGTPSLGANIPFDSVLVVTGAGVATARDLTNGGATPLTAILDGNSLMVHVPFSALPTQGFDLDEYTWNLWPRLGTGSNTQISDFAPDFNNARVTVVPEPGAMALLLGCGVAGMRLLWKTRSKK